MIRLLARTTLFLGCATLAFPALAETAESAEGTAASMGAAQPATEIVVVGEAEDAGAIAGSFGKVNDEDLRRSRVLNVNDALRQVPGVFARDEEGAGMRANIGIRGLNPIRSTKVLLLEDGIPLGFAPYGDNAAYYHPPIQRFTGIEVLKGAAQVRFGPQTIGGVVNYITPDVPQEFTARGTVAGGNRDMLMLDGQVGGRLLGGGVLVHVNHNQTDGNRDNQSLKFTDIFVKGAWELGESHGLTLKLSRFREDSQVSYSGLRRDEFAADPRGNVFVNDDFQTERLNATLAHRWDLAANLTLRTTTYYHHFTRDWWRQSSNSNQRPNDASDPACGGLANLNNTCGNEGRLRDYDTYGIETRLSIHHGLIGIGGETEIGLRYHEERQTRRQWNGDTPDARTPGTGVNAGVRENNERDANAFSAFIQSRLVFGDFALTPGVRAEFIDFARRNLPIDLLVGGRPSGAVSAATSGASSLDKVLPGLGATWEIADNITLYGGVHRGFAPPRVEDIITAEGGSVDLDPELSWNYEIGLRGLIEGWMQFNLAASYGPPGGKWEVFTSMRNLFDRLYVTDRARGALPGQPFTIQVGLTLRY